MDSSEKLRFLPSGARELPSEKLDGLLARYGWFAPLRVLHELRTGRPDARLAVVAPWRGQSSLRQVPVDVAALTAEPVSDTAAPQKEEKPGATIPPAAPVAAPAREPRAAAASPDELIDRFLEETDLRIVAEEGEPEGEVRTAPQLDDADEVVSERLAEIYLAQGLRDRAAAIYRKLSLLNPEKSIYFAELIGKMENNN